MPTFLVRPRLLSALLPAPLSLSLTSSPSTLKVIKAGKVVETLKGADPNGLRRIVQTHAGPNPPIKPLPADAEKAKEEGNVLLASLLC